MKKILERYFIKRYLNKTIEAAKENGWTLKDRKDCGDIIRKSMKQKIISETMAFKYTIEIFEIPVKS